MSDPFNHDADAGPHGAIDDSLRCPACDAASFRRLRGTPLMPATCSACGAQVHASHLWLVMAVAALVSAVCFAIAARIQQMWPFLLGAGALVAWIATLRSRQRLVLASPARTTITRAAVVALIGTVLLARWVGGS
ncbi:MAG: hypothetical protein M3Q40_05570 [Pseudomonadota bacterium]|nr:hypothetical protein [Pseudomonadota bacterium]